MAVDPTPLVVTVDADDTPTGSMDKLQAHQDPGVLHRAVSACLFDRRGFVLLQRRAQAKYHFAGRWSNACCTHPAPGERPQAAIERRVREELGLSGLDLRPVGTFTYRAVDPGSGLVEHELDHVFASTVTEDPTVDPDEIMDWRFVDPAAVTDWSASRFTPWLSDVLHRADVR